MATAPPVGRFERWRRLRATDDYGLVLALVIAMFVLATALPESGWSKLVLVVLGSGTLVLTLWTAGTHERTVRLVAAVSVLLLLASAASLAAGGDVSNATLALSWGAFAAATPFVIVRSLQATLEVTRRTVTGALCIYLLIGMLFTALYAVVATFGSDPFFASAVDPDTSNLLYFSYVTEATVGYGDLTAAGGLGRAMAATEGLIGQIYLVTVVALVIGNLGRRRQA
jgi:Ion channel